MISGFFLPAFILEEKRLCIFFHGGGGMRKEAVQNSAAEEIPPPSFCRLISSLMKEDIIERADEFSEIIFTQRSLEAT